MKKHLGTDHDRHESHDQSVTIAKFFNIAQNLFPPLLQLGALGGAPEPVAVLVHNNLIDLGGRRRFFRASHFSNRALLSGAGIGLDDQLQERPGIVSQAFGLCSRQGIVEGVVLQFILCVEAEGRREVTEFSRLPDLPRHPDTTRIQPGFLLLLIALRQGPPDAGWAGRNFWRLRRHLRIEELVVRHEIAVLRMLHFCLEGMTGRAYVDVDPLE